MLKKTIPLAFAATAILAASGAAQAGPALNNPNIQVKPKPNPAMPRSPRLTPQQRGALNIADVSDVSSGYNTQGNVRVGGYICPRSFLFFPAVSANKAVNGRVSISERDLGDIGSARFSVSNFLRQGRYLVVQPTIIYAPDWERIGPGYQFSFKVRVDSLAGTNWRVEKQNFYHACQRAPGGSMK